MTARAIVSINRLRTASSMKSSFDRWSAHHASASGIEEKRPCHLDGDRVADRKTRIGIAQRHEIALAERDMEVVLIAQMLDPRNGSQRAAVLRLADAHMLGAHADGRRRGRRRHTWKSRARHEVDAERAQPGGDVDVGRTLVDLPR